MLAKRDFTKKESVQQEGMGQSERSKALGESMRAQPDMAVIRWPESLVVSNPREFAAWTVWAGTFSAFLTTLSVLSARGSGEGPMLSLRHLPLLFLAMMGVGGMVTSTWAVWKTRGFSRWHHLSSHSLRVILALVFAGQVLTVLGGALVVLWLLAQAL